MAEITIRDLEQQDIFRVAAMIRDTFSTFIATDYSAEGQDRFFAVAGPEAIASRLAADSFALLAVCGDAITGFIEVRDCRHIVLLFTDAAWHRRGIAGRLVRQAVEKIKVLRPETAEVTVNSSPYALAAYEHLGFSRQGPTQTRDGITFTPMAMLIENNR